MGSRTGREEEQLGLGVGEGCEPSGDALGTVEMEGMRPGPAWGKGYQTVLSILWMEHGAKWTF